MGKNAGFVIRTATSADRAAIQEVTLAAYEQYIQYMPPEAWDMYKADIIEKVANIGSRAEQIVAESDGAIAGSVLIIPADSVVEVSDDESARRRWPEIRLLAVAPSARGKGIGEALTRECIKRTREAGIPTVTLHTLDVMQVAMRMYEKIGFVRMPELDYLPDPEFVVKGYRYDTEP